MRFRGTNPSLGTKHVFRCNNILFFHLPNTFGLRVKTDILQSGFFKYEPNALTRWTDITSTEMQADLFVCRLT